MTRVRTSVVLLLYYLLSVLSTSTYAEGDVQLHGFFSQNFLYSNKNKFFGDSDDGSFEFYELGLNASWAINSRFRLAGQALIRDAGSSDDGRPRIDYLFAEYLFWSGEVDEVSLRLGRVLNPYGFFSATRDVAGTRPGILLPQSVYVDANRQFALSADGVQLNWVRPIGDGELNLDVSKVEPRTSDPDLEVNILGRPFPGKITGDRSTWLGKLTYDYDFGRWRFAWTQGKVYVDYEPAPVDVLLSGQLYFRPTVLSVQHQRERWGFTAEVMRRQSTLTGLGFPTAERTGDNFFLQADYRHENFSYFLRYDRMIKDNHDPYGRKLEAANRGPAYTAYAKDWTLGGRWSVSQNLALAAEFHAVEGTAWLSSVQNDGIPGSKYWNLLLFSVSARY